jgi:hypothetical protein
VSAEEFARCDAFASFPFRLFVVWRCRLTRNAHASHLPMVFRYSKQFEYVERLCVLYESDSSMAEIMNVMQEVRARRTPM